MFRKSKDNPGVFKIYSFYNSKVNPKIPKYQEAVFKHFGFNINQIKGDNFKDHGDFLNHICKNVIDTEFIVVFDIDCIPVKKNWFHKLMQDLREPKSIVGAAQTANHLQEGKNIYISPFFFAIATVYLKELSYPDMNMTEDMDAGQNLTEQIIRNGGQVKYWWPTDIEEEKWALYHLQHTKFGLGTTYNDCIYHAFFSRANVTDRFIVKCKSILPALVRFRLRHFLKGD